MRKFDTKVQHLKYKVLREVARESWNGTLMEHVLDIPKTIVPGTEPTMRCCVYKERAILAERVKIAMGGDKENPNVIEVIEIACDECPVGGFEVTNACRGCLAHRCEDVCRFGAISFDENHVAHIDKTKCKECGACSKVCPYTAIVSRKRPCQNACKGKAISMNEHKAATIANEKCISCGACVYQCPFGAIMDKSFILDAIELLKKSEAGGDPVYALVAPSISSQFTYAKLGQVITGLKKLGFYTVIEAALGADMVAQAESKELVEKGFLTSSCCPAFVKYVQQNFPQMVQYVSHNLSPMATLAKYLKETTPNAKVVFIGPCTAKKVEIKQDDVKGAVDYVLTFEELRAILDARGLELAEMPEITAGEPSSYGRIFARTGGVAESVRRVAKLEGIETEINPIRCSGIEECIKTMKLASFGRLEENLIEGMACKGGCTNGAASIFHDQRGIQRVNDFSRLALTDNPMEGIRGYDMAGVNMEREFPELEKMKEVTAGEKKAKRQATAKAKKEAIAKGEVE